MTATTRDLELQRTWHEEDYKGFVDFLHGYLGNLAHKFGLNQVSLLFLQTNKKGDKSKKKQTVVIEETIEDEVFVESVDRSRTVKFLKHNTWRLDNLEHLKDDSSC